jgi:hypothetical protein
MANSQLFVDIPNTITEVFGDALASHLQVSLKDTCTVGFMVNEIEKDIFLIT